VIDWVRNVTSKEKSRWVGVRVVSKVNDDLGRKRRTKKFSFNFNQIGGLDKSF
jgi:hypothetical protein